MEIDLDFREYKCSCDSKFNKRINEDGSRILYCREHTYDYWITLEEYIQMTTFFNNYNINGY